MQYNVILNIVISSTVSAPGDPSPPNCIISPDSKCLHVQQSIFPCR